MTIPHRFLISSVPTLTNYLYGYIQFDRGRSWFGIKRDYFPETAGNIYLDYAFLPLHSANCVNDKCDEVFTDGRLKPACGEDLEFVKPTYNYRKDERTRYNPYPETPKPAKKAKRRMSKTESFSFNPKSEFPKFTDPVGEFKNPDECFSSEDKKK